MDSNIRTSISNLKSEDKNIRYEAFTKLFSMTENKVDWAYEVWDFLMDDLTHPNNHRRAIASQLLANLAKSDPDKRMKEDFPKIFAVTKDERFVTARHTLQSVWKIGLVNNDYKSMVVQALKNRFKECENEKNYTLIRYDIIVGLKKLYDVDKDETIKKLALTLIDSEQDTKYQKKYAGVWKNV
ncbi:MAG TPA: hypothetical protein VK072_05265 [Candidatus Avamphibacillus sp.]|nr:hypothetical protein [Candidatus Avamphibacillus sp.]